MADSIWTIEVDQASADKWSQMLELFDDANIYQTAAYGEIHWGAKHLSRLVLKRDGNIVSVAQLRIIQPSPLKFGIAYLRWGPLWERRSETFDSEVPSRMARAIEAEYVRKRRLFVRILPNAFADSPRAQVFQSAFSSFVSERQASGSIYRTFVVDLAPSVEELRSRLDAKWRNKLKQAEKNQLTVVMGNGSSEFRAFCEMYAQMRNRKTFETTVDVEEFARMQEVLPESQRMQVFLCKDAEVPYAGVVVTAVGDTAIYLLGATSDAGLNARGAYLLHWKVMSWLKVIGVKRYDLGGIDPDGNPGVYYFKRGFSGADLSHIAPIKASESRVSSAIVNLGSLVRRVSRSSHRPLNRLRPTEEPVSSV
jgi:lipid II:glycine glycyltransferase (peptidoglycan interpeptide bridge formation enzyme)